MNNNRQLMNDIELHGYIIKNVPVYPDYKNQPSENVSGDVLVQLYKLIESHRTQKMIEYQATKDM